MTDASDEAVFAAAAALSADRVAPFVEAQAPQAAAALLLLFPPDRAAAVLNGLSGDGRRRILRAMAGTRPMAEAARPVFAAVLRAEVLEGGDARDRRMRDVAVIVGALAPDLRDDALAALVAPVPPLPVPPLPVAEGPEPSAPRPALPPGLAAFLDNGRITVERMPMLEVVMDRFVRILASRLRMALGRPADVRLAALRSTRFGDWMAARCAAESLFVVARAAAWDGHLLLWPDRAALDGWVEALTGGGDGTAGLRRPDRALTALDRALAAVPAGAALDALETAFAPVGAAGLALDRVEADDRRAWIDRPHNAAFLAELALDVDGRTGRLDLLLPYATLEPVRDRLRRMFVGERFGEDTLWRAHLRAELGRASTPVQAVAGSLELPLGALLAWRPGTVVALDGNGRVALEVGGVAVARGALGRSGGRWSVVTGADADADSLALPAAEADALPAGADPRHRVPVRVVVVLGGSALPMAALGGNGLGTVVLDRAVDEPVAILAGGRAVALGGLVRVGAGLGVRLSAVARPER
ncbi:FliM/FliN family flagellar motor switch protein [Azospirillum sp. A39]|uniref:FliM/FliN family flagellar motor switch protein n=1 Tax=Azospirillum sp. A39 TaxID=3462279 RepID=UPI0040453ACA